MGSYLLRLVCICLIYGLCRALLEKNSSPDRLLRVVASMILFFLILSPILRLDALRFPEPELPFDACVLSGQEAVQEAMRTRIMEGVEAYILNKAADLGLCPEVEVGLSDQEPFVPVSVTLRCAISTEHKIKLTDILCSTLGLCEENIQWIE